MSNVAMLNFDSRSPAFSNRYSHSACLQVRETLETTLDSLSSSSPNSSDPPVEAADKTFTLWLLKRWGKWDSFRVSDQVLVGSRDGQDFQGKYDGALQ
jgi:hypothetical protein